MMYEITKNGAQQIIMIHSPRRGPLCRSSGCGCDHRDVSYYRTHLADETTGCRWRNYRPGNTPYNSMSYKMSVVYDVVFGRVGQSLSITRCFINYRVVADRARTQHSHDTTLSYFHTFIQNHICIYKVLLKYVYI